MKRVLVTGATGFIGRQVVPHLISSGFDVYAVARHKPSQGHGVRFYQADLLEPKDRARMLRRIKPTHLLHLAWDVTPGLYWNWNKNVDWLEASVDLFLNFAKGGGRRCVAVGTCAEYDWTVPGPFTVRDSPLKPASLYGACKASLGHILQVLAQQKNVSTAWARLFYLYGPGEEKARLVPSLIGALRSGKPALCQGGHLRRDYMHVDDAARAIVHLLDSDFEGPLNIASGQSVALSQIGRILAELFHKPRLLRLKKKSIKSGEPMDIRGDIKPLKTLGFRPTYSLKEGLAETVAWWQRSV